ncbi:MAG: B12-binding domain-containing radical SAM protein [Eubacteriaceae bacterium]
MKILLLEHPRNISQENINDIANAPLSSSLFTGYIAALLSKEKKDEVEIIEGYLEKKTYDEIYKKICEFKPQVIGVHLVYQWKTDWDLFKLFERLKSENKVEYVTAYGYYPNFAYKEVLDSCNAIDSIILGEPETPFYNLVDDIRNNKKHIESKGIVYKKSNGQFHIQYEQPFEQLDDLPFPIRTKASLGIGEVNIMGSRGCYGNCTFCYINPFIGEKAKWRGRSAENIVKEIDEIIVNTKMRYFYFTDPNFFGPGIKGKERVKKLATLLKKRNIKFGIEARVNDIEEETIECLVDAGLNHILIGLESGKEESLKRLNKMTTVEQNEEAIKILRKYGINPNVGFIMFEPDSTIKDLRINFEFLKRNKLLYDLDITVNVLYHHMIILQGTKAYRQLQGEKRLIISPLSTYEGTAEYKNYEVAKFASIMRDVTNFIFLQLKKMWNKKEFNKESYKDNFANANERLIQVFEKTLVLVEEGNNITDEYMDKTIKKTKEYIKRYLMA